MCLLRDVVGKGKSFGYNHKIITIRFKSRHLVLRLLGNLMIYKTPSKGLIVQGEDTLLLDCFSRSSFYSLVFF